MTTKTKTPRKLKAGKARGVNKKTAPMTMAHIADEKSKASAKTNERAKRTHERAPGTITTVDIAKEHDMSPKTLRARIRRNIDKWQSLFVDGQRHVFKDNKTTRAKIDALLA